MFSEGTKSLEEEVSRREAELNATPEQRMEMLQDDIDDNDDAFEQIQSKIDQKGAVALAHSELDEQEVQARQEADALNDKTTADNEPQSTAGIVDATLVDDDD